MEGQTMAFFAVNKSNRIGALFYDEGKSESVPAQGRVSIELMPKYWTNNIRVVEAKEPKEPQKKVKKESAGEAVNG
jgi:hypothetical protein